MPFTFAHPLAVMPIGLKQNKYFDLTALIIGSMAPDFEYFIHFKPYQLHGHTILGQLYYNLPIVILVAVLWHYLIKEQIIINLPKPFDTYYFYLMKANWNISSVKAFFVFVASALFGMFTHLLWDSFTHVEGYFVSSIGFLSSGICFLNHEIPIYKILQHGSTLIGVSILALLLIRLQQKNVRTIVEGPNTTSRLLFWISIIIIDIIIVGFIITLKRDFSAGRLIVSLISGGFIGTVIASIFFKSISNRKSNKVV